MSQNKFLCGTPTNSRRDLNGSDKSSNEDTMPFKERETSSFELRWHNMGARDKDVSVSLYSDQGNLEDIRRDSDRQASVSMARGNNSDRGSSHTLNPRHTKQTHTDR